MLRVLHLSDCHYAAGNLEEVDKVLSEGNDPIGQIASAYVTYFYYCNLGKRPIREEFLPVYDFFNPKLDLATNLTSIRLGLCERYTSKTQ